ncbi:MAG: helix-turn-helix transcriptional regulator [Planctomycetales bacterium]|nr:helix-turn-helix transcriptional regulator [Planctomycetales bacterium]
MSKKPTFTEQLRQAIREAPVTRYQIWQDTGIGQPLLSKFLSGDCGLSLETVDTLTEYLGLELKPTKKRTRRRET